MSDGGGADRMTDGELKLIGGLTRYEKAEISKLFVAWGKWLHCQRHHAQQMDSTAAKAGREPLPHSFGSRGGPETTTFHQLLLRQC